MMITMILLYNLETIQFDIETAFLNGDLEETIYMEFPEGYERYLMDQKVRLDSKKLKGDIKMYCLLLKKALYGLVQAARQWWKKITETLAKIGFKPTEADPCLFVRHGANNEPPAFIILYVDDGGIIGTPKVIQEVLKALASVFKVKNLGRMEHFVGCHLIRSKDKNTIWIHQPKLIKHLESKFKDYIVTDRVFKTPAAPRTVFMRPGPNDPKLSPTNQKTYRSGVGMLLYLIKHSRPDLSNAVRELSKVLDGATDAHWKALIRTIKYVLDTKMYALRIKPNLKKGMFHLEGFLDSDFAGDRETRFSVHGYIIYFCGAPISWKSKASKSVTLSSTEAEYFAASETAKELMFVYGLLEGMGMKERLELPFTLRIDNTGAMYLANNHATDKTY